MEAGACILAVCGEVTANKLELPKTVTIADNDIMLIFIC